jgi:hypothetical protein
VNVFLEGPDTEWRTVLKDGVRGCGLDSSGSEQGLVAEPCKQYNSVVFAWSNPLKVGRFLHQARHCQLLNNDSNTWVYIYGVSVILKTNFAQRPPMACCSYRVSQKPVTYFTEYWWMTQAQRFGWSLLSRFWRKRVLGSKKDNGTRTSYIRVEQNLVDLICGVSYGSLNICWYLTLRILVAASGTMRFNIQKFYFLPTEFIYMFF